MGRPIVIVGASTRAAAQSARRAGFAPYCCDMFCDTDLDEAAEKAIVAPDYPDGVPEIVAGFPEAPWMYVGAMENSPELVAKISRSRELWGNGADVLSQVREPIALRNLLVANNIVGIDVLAATAPPANVRSAREWLIKPIRSAAGRRVVWFDPDQPAGMNEPYVFQRHVEGTAMSAVMVADETDVELCGATRQLIGETAFGASEFGYCGSIGPADILRDLQEQLVSIGHALRKDAGVRGLFGVDFIFDGWTAWVTEVNPRYTASVEVLEQAYQRPLVNFHAAAFAQFEGAMSALSRSATGRSPKCHQYGKAVVFADADGAVGDLAAMAKSQDIHLADIPQPGAQLQAGEPICSVFADSNRESKTEELLQRHARTIREACSTS